MGRGFRTECRKRQAKGRIAPAVVAAAVTLGAVGNALATTTSDIAATAGATGLLAGDDALTSNSDESLPGARINSLSSSVTSTDLIAGTNLKSVSSLLGVTGAGAEMYLSVNAAASSSDGASAIWRGKSRDRWQRRRRQHRRHARRTCHRVGLTGRHSIN